jgi:hypothetical protein
VVRCALPRVYGSKGITSVASAVSVCGAALCSPPSFPLLSPPPANPHSRLLTLPHSPSPSLPLPPSLLLLLLPPRARPYGTGLDTSPTLCVCAFLPAGHVSQGPTSNGSGHLPNGTFRRLCLPVLSVFSPHVHPLGAPATHAKPCSLLSCPRPSCAQPFSPVHVKPCSLPTCASPVPSPRTPAPSHHPNPPGTCRTPLPRHTHFSG